MALSESDNLRADCNGSGSRWIHAPHHRQGSEPRESYWRRSHQDSHDSTAVVLVNASLRLCYGLAVLYADLQRVGCHVMNGGNRLV